ncbi:MAG: sulfotransferase, partial [Phycisphaerales bacterium]|nr:sulfotransferase [Phycisphaerales bacterium]
LTDSYLPWPSNIFDMRVEDAGRLGDRYRSSTAMFNKGKKIVSNKSLALYLQMGFLSLILPGSRGIMIHRHPLDNAVSCFTTNLIASGHVYTNTLEALAEMWIQRRQMQDFWLENLDIPVMDLHYENLVGNQEEESRRLIEFLGLPWEPKCLEFHTSTNVARTISYDQVNKKMYKTSKGRWSNYEKHLGPLIDAFDKYL